MKKLVFLMLFSLICSSYSIVNARDRSRNVQRVIVSDQIVAFTHPNFVVAQPLEIQNVIIREVQPVFVQKVLRVQRDNHCASNVCFERSLKQDVRVEVNNVREFRNVRQRRVEINVQSSRNRVGSNFLALMAERRANRANFLRSLGGRRSVEVNRSFQRIVN